jgi:crotonobetainyl-CoA:carnitine CoA-transferase CaiB-like acyl-CoA transferase
MLDGLKVIELATYIAAPGAGGVLADWGADVIKVEAPGGDPIRAFHEDNGTELKGNPVFDMDNRGKRAMVLDIRNPVGREALLRLLSDADVFLTNTRPGALKRARLDWDSLHAANPRLIYCSVTGYGLSGPEADRPGFDVAAYWSRAGVAALTTVKGQEPFPIRTGMGDHVTSLATVGAVLAAVIERGRTGRGRLVETSLIRSGVYSVASDLAIQLRYGRLASTRPRKGAINPLSNFFRTSDGRWLTILTRRGGKDWTELVHKLGCPELADDERFASARSRRQNGEALVEALDAAFGALSFAEAAGVLDACDFVWAPVQTAAEVAADPQAEAAGCFTAIPDGEGGAFRIPAAPARFHGADAAPRGPAPTLGQHTDEILLGAGYSADEVADLRAAGAAI